MEWTQCIPNVLLLIAIKKNFKQSGLKNLPEESAGMWEKPKTGIQIKDISFYTDTSFLILLLPIQLASIKSL